MTDAPRFELAAIDLFERDVRLRMPFRFGVVTLTAAPQAFARVTITLADGRRAQGAAAELLAPKWFDKNPALSNEDNFEQLRTSLRLARDAYLGGGQAPAFGHFEMHYAAHVERCAGVGLNALIAGYGPALIDRAVLDSLCRALKLPFYQAIRSNAAGIVPSPLYADLAGFDLAGFWPGCNRRARSQPGIPSGSSIPSLVPIRRRASTTACRKPSRKWSRATVTAGSS